MSAKGSKNCCCDGCNERPYDRALSISAIQPMQQFCCGCIPKQICVTITSGNDTVTVLFDRNCSAIPNDPILYSGIISVNGTAVSLEFRLKVINNECYICVKVVGGSESCILINSTQQLSPNHFCQKMWVDGLPIEWIVDEMTISIGPANNIPIEGRSAECLDANNNIVSDTNLIRNICGGCGCICQCACILVYGDRRQAIIYEACLDANNKYITSNGIEILLNANPTTKCCQLSIVNTGDLGVVPGSLLFPDKSIVNECPDPEVSWSAFSHPDYIGSSSSSSSSSSGSPSPTAEAVFIAFYCKSCGCPTIRASPCCEKQFPLVLTAVVTTTCPDCPSFSVSLIYNRIAAAWIGYMDKAMCGHSIKLTLTCGAPDWTLAFEGSPCTNQSDTVAATSCDPVSISFSFSTGGLGCCGLGSGINPDITVVVTE